MNSIARAIRGTSFRARPVASSKSANFSRISSEGRRVSRSEFSCRQMSYFSHKRWHICIRSFRQLPRLSPLHRVVNRWSTCSAFSFRIAESRRSSSIASVSVFVRRCDFSRTKRRSMWCFVEFEFESLRPRGAPSSSSGLTTGIVFRSITPSRRAWRMPAIFARACWTGNGVSGFVSSTARSSSIACCSAQGWEVGGGCRFLGDPYVSSCSRCSEGL
mmetsp:Transcript_11204/g.27391  ORF Transcript_11204/g.27391 Transcript_11204/m.27391 type:complete len:217 (-) Transcript_11204:428-1078(-)